MLKNLLVYRLALFNLTMSVGLVYAWFQGAVQYVFANDHSHVTYLITLVFILGLLGTFNSAWKVSKALNELKATSWTSPSFKAKISKLSTKSAWIYTVMNALTGIGIVGTVIGMSMMLKDLTPDSGVTAVLQGASVAFMCTLVGIGTTVWTEINYRMLSTAQELLKKDAGVD